AQRVRGRHSQFFPRKAPRYLPDIDSGCASFDNFRMQITAAVVRERSAPFALEKLELAEPRPDELIVRVVASGLCQTDLHGRDGYFASPYPAVYGHEGAGVVHAVGTAVGSLAP